MLNFPFRVKRVSQLNFHFFDVLILSGAVALSALFFVFIFLANTALASSVTVAEIIKLTNEDRKNKDLSELAENEKLSQAAARKAESMIFENYFSHNSPSGSTPWRWIEEADYEYAYAGENLAMDFTSAQKMNEAWLASPTHRANILNEKYEDIGVAVKEGTINGQRTTLVVQIFGSGDKNISEDGESAQVQKQAKNIFAGEKAIPMFPADQTREKRISLEKPLITSPPGGGYTNGENIEITGRAEPGSSLTVLDGKAEIGSAVSDERGWFKINAGNFSSGSHELRVASWKSPAKSGTPAISDGVIVYVDQTEPELDYSLYADSRIGSYVMKIWTQKEDCLFELNGEKAAGSPGRDVIFSVSLRASFLAISATDRAGNKARKQVSLENFHIEKNANSLFDDFALVFFPQEVYAADSARVTLARNLGLGTGGLKN